ncbi:hypothetical protein [Methylorubrum sp. Q1]|uniref:hypothetical protein n=1 Tax=Methylorubrum sp. Q1 TaxID=2562453 RepID=UPI001FE0901A|nr:hypothetical protein [Methylorubrum sp. Q1]
MAAVIAQHDVTSRQLPSSGRLPHDLARALAERAVDAVMAADSTMRQQSSKGA